jgi:hypothetical protein
MSENSAPVRRSNRLAQKQEFDSKINPMDNEKQSRIDFPIPDNPKKTRKKTTNFSETKNDNIKEEKYSNAPGLCSKIVQINGVTFYLGKV